MCHNHGGGYKPQRHKEHEGDGQELGIRGVFHKRFRGQILFILCS